MAFPWKEALEATGRKVPPSYGQHKKAMSRYETSSSCYPPYQEPLVTN